MFYWKINHQWQFSIATSNYQRVQPQNSLWFSKCPTTCPSSVTTLHHPWIPRIPQVFECCVWRWRETNVATLAMPAPRSGAFRRSASRWRAEEIIGSWLSYEWFFGIICLYIYIYIMIPYRFLMFDFLGIYNLFSYIIYINIYPIISRLTCWPWESPSVSWNQSSNPDDCQGLC